MNETLSRRFKWVFLGVLLLVVYLLQSVVLSRYTLLGTKVSLLVTAVCTLASCLPHTQAGWMALSTAALWSLTSQTSGGAYLLLLPLAALLIGWVCTHYLARNIGTAMLGAAFGVALCEGGFILQQWYMHQPLPANILNLWLLQIACGAVLAPLFLGLMRLIERMVKPWKEA